MHQHVHAGDPQHRCVEVEAVEHGRVAARRLGAVDQSVRVVLAHVLARGHEEACGTAGGIADHVLCGRHHHVDHQGDDVPRCAELAVGAGGGELRQQVLVQITVGVPVIQRDRVEHVHDLAQQPRARDRVPGAGHVFGVRRGAVRIVVGVIAERTEEGEHFLVHEAVHLRGVGQLLDRRPAQVRLTLRERHRGAGAAQAAQLALRPLLLLVQLAQEQQVGDLLDHLERIRDASGSEGVPDAVHAVLQFSRDHPNESKCASDHRAPPPLRGTGDVPAGTPWAVSAGNGTVSPLGPARGAAGSALRSPATPPPPRRSTPP